MNNAIDGFVIYCTLKETDVYLDFDKRQEIKSAAEQIYYK